VFPHLASELPIFFGNDDTHSKSVLGERLPIRNDKSNKSMKNKVLFQKTILKVMRISFYQVLIAIICTTMAEAREGVAQSP
jgi:hypothetical protein